MGVSLCTGPICEVGVLDYDAGWGVGCVGSSLRAPVPSSRFTSQCLHRGTHTGRIQTLSFSTVFIVTP